MAVIAPDRCMYMRRSGERCALHRSHGDDHAFIVAVDPPTIESEKKCAIMRSRDETMARLADVLRRSGAEDSEDLLRSVERLLAVGDRMEPNKEYFPEFVPAQWARAYAVAVIEPTEALSVDTRGTIDSRSFVGYLRGVGIFSEATPTMMGSRATAVIASTWSNEGYGDAARQCLDIVRHMYPWLPISERGA